jgi:hypothetical protein
VVVVFCIAVKFLAALGDRFHAFEQLLKVVVVPFSIASKLMATFGIHYFMCWSS